ncbi:hypothetical protein ACFE04_025183 [Oxalis oulophora]
MTLRYEKEIVNASLTLDEGDHTSGHVVNINNNPNHGWNTKNDDEGDHTSGHVVNINNNPNHGWNTKNDDMDNRRASPKRLRAKSRSRRHSLHQHTNPRREREGKKEPHGPKLTPSL